jgi:hypothetical protein
MFDLTDRYFSFTCDDSTENGRHEIDFIRYDRVLDQVTSQVKWYTVCGQTSSTYTNCPAYQYVTGGGANPLNDVNMIRLNQHPSHGYITVLWQAGGAQCGGGTNASWRRGCGTEVFNDSWTFLGPASAFISHQDVGYDVNGVPVWVGISSNTGTDSDYRALEITNLTTLSTSGITSKRVLFPCSYSYQLDTCDTGMFLPAKAAASHVSMTGSWGSLLGYGLVSTMMNAGAYKPGPVDYPSGTTLGTAVAAPGTVTVTPASMSQIGVGVVSLIDYGNTNVETVTWTATTATTATAIFAHPHAATANVGCLSCGDTGFGAMENIAVKIDTTAADGSNAVFYRLGRTMGIRDETYNAEPHTAVNRDFTQFTWGSTWNRDDPSSNGSLVSGYWTKLPTN